MENIVKQILHHGEFTLDLTLGRESNIFDFRSDGSVEVKCNESLSYGIYTCAVNETVNEYDHLNDEMIFDVAMYILTKTFVCSIRLSPGGGVNSIRRSFHKFGEYYSKESKIFAKKGCAVVALPHYIKRPGAIKHYMGFVHFDSELENVTHREIVDCEIDSRIIQNEFGNIFYGTRKLESNSYIMREVTGGAKKNEFIVPAKIVTCNQYYIITQTEEATFRLLTRALKFVMEFSDVKHVIFTVFGLVVIDKLGHVDLYDVSVSNNVNKLGRLKARVSDVAMISFNCVVVKTLGSDIPRIL